MRKFIEDLLVLPDANSRFVYLCQGVATAIVILMVGLAFVLTHDAVARDGFSTFMGMLLGGGSVGAVARGWAKKAGVEAETKSTQATTEAVKSDTVNKLVEDKVS